MNKNLKTNKQPVKKDERVVIAITAGYIQQFVEDNYGRELTGPELQELADLIWEEGDHELMSWIDKAIRRLIGSSNKK